MCVGLLRRGTCTGFQKFLSKEKWHHVLMLLTEIMLVWLYFNLFNEQFMCIFIKIYSDTW